MNINRPFSSKKTKVCWCCRIQFISLTNFSMGVLFNLFRMAFFVLLRLYVRQKIFWFIFWWFPSSFDRKKRFHYFTNLKLLFNFEVLNFAVFLYVNFTGAETQVKSRIEFVLIPVFSPFFSFFIFLFSLKGNASNI